MHLHGHAYFTEKNDFVKNLTTKCMIDMRKYLVEYVKTKQNHIYINS